MANPRAAEVKRLRKALKEKEALLEANAVERRALEAELASASDDLAAEISKTHFRVVDAVNMRLLYPGEGDPVLRGLVDDLHSLLDRMGIDFVEIGVDTWFTRDVLPFVEGLLSAASEERMAEMVERNRGYWPA